MKRVLYSIIFITTLFLSFRVFASDYIITAFSIHNSTYVETDKEKRFSISQADGNWQDNLGNYGKSKILFYTDSVKNKDGFISGIAELINQNGDKFWLTPSRSDKVKDAGVGKMLVIETDKYYDFLFLKKCTYAIKYLEDRSYMRILCK